MASSSSNSQAVFCGKGHYCESASQDALVDIFERIESLLEEYSEVPTTEAMRDIVVKIMVEEVQMAIVQMLIIAHHIKDGVDSVDDKVNVAIEVKVTPMETLSTHYHLFQGEFGAADLGVSASVNSSAAATFAALSLRNATRPGLGPRPREEASGLESRRNRADAGSLALYRALNLNTGQMGWTTLHRSDVVHCDLKAANILTTKTGNVKLSDFGVSLNLPVRAMEREIKDVTGTPNWMAPEVIEVKGASPKSDIWSLGCTVIELLTRFLQSLTQRKRTSACRVPHKECFHEGSSMQPSAEQLFESGKAKFADFSKDLRPHTFPSAGKCRLQKNGSARQLMANIELDSPIPVYAGQPFDGDMAMLSSSPSHHSFTGSASPVLPEVPQSEADLFEIREHTLVKTTFGKCPSSAITQRELELDLRADRYIAVNCHVCMEPAKKGRGALFALQHHRLLQVRRLCSADLRPRSNLLMHAHFAERCNSPAEFFTRLPNHHPTSASSSRGSLHRDRPLAIQQRSRAFLTRHTPTSVSLVAATPPPHSHPPAKVTGVISEGNVIRRKLSIILTRQREPQLANNAHLRERPQSMSSVGSSCANSPQSQSLQSNSLRSLQAVVAGY
ncbi:hypothetical protein EDB84DRAFT_1566793 [Lactarius hengduanensis]|nr:hypothetical protein EDB84DRAFT_1566793 [Lactarius hengduanensis]